MSHDQSVKLVYLCNDELFEIFQRVIRFYTFYKRNFILSIFVGALRNWKMRLNCTLVQETCSRWHKNGVVGILSRLHRLSAGLCKYPYCVAQYCNMARTTEGSKVSKHTTFQIQWRECYLQGLKDKLFCSAINHGYIHAEAWYRKVMRTYRPSQ